MTETSYCPDGEILLLTRDMEFDIHVPESFWGDVFSWANTFKFKYLEKKLEEFSKFLGFTSGVEGK